MACNIVKEIDSLGRIVLPKDIRKSLDLNCGDKINLSIDEDKIYLTKTTFEKQLKNIGEKVCDSIYEGSDCACIITEQEKIVACAGLSKKYINKNILINENSIVIGDKKFDYSKVVYCDIIVNAGGIGKIILLINKNTKPPLDCFLNAFCRFLGKYLDE